MELLADFIADVAIVGVKLFQFAGEGVNVRGGEGVGRDASLRRPRTARASRPYLAKPPHNVQHVQGPTALGDGNFFQRFDALEFFADFGGRNDDGSSRRESALTYPVFSGWSGLTSAATGDDEWNPRLNRNAIQGKIATNPAVTAGGGGEWLALDDGGGREGEMWNEQEIFNPPCGEIHTA